jgi:hypothetical protein
MAGAAGTPLELDSFEGVFLKLLGNTSPRQAAVSSATRDIPMVLGEDSREVFAFDLAYQVVCKLRQPPVDINEGGARQLSR